MIARVSMFLLVLLGFYTNSLSQNIVAGSTYYLQHEYSGKYLCTGGQENGAAFHTWGPVPTGHESRYRFRIMDAGVPGYYYLLHEYSGKFLCTGGLENGAVFHTWGPIPTGHEPRYRFKIVDTGIPDYYYLQHEYSGKYLFSNGQVNGAAFLTWGPIQVGQELMHRFKITTQPTVAALSNEPVRAFDSQEVADGRFISADATLYRDGTLDLKVSSRTTMAFYGMKGRVMVLCVDTQGRCIYVSDVFACKTLCSTTDPTCKSKRKNEPFIQKLPKSIGENTAKIVISMGDDMDFYDIRQTMKNTIQLCLDTKEIVGPVAEDAAKLIAML